MIIIITLLRFAHPLDAVRRDFKTGFAEQSNRNWNDRTSEQTVIQFESGWFSTESFEIISCRMDLRGNMTRLSIAEENPKSLITSLKPNTVHDSNVGNPPKLWLLDVQNSTLWMTSWCLDVEQAGCSACVISSSDLTIVESEIISNMECSPFIVTGDLDGHGCQIQIMRSSHKSTSNLVLPLVGTSQHPHLNPIGLQMKNDDMSDNESHQHLSISGVGLSMTNQHFQLGTGPLFTFHSRPVFDCSMDVETSLLESSLVNMSCSSSFPLGQQLFGSELCQRVVGSCVQKSTNHDSGTGMMSPNLGGNVMCLNTSFSSCIRQSNRVYDYSFQNRTQSTLGRFAIDFNSEATSVIFTLCTFKDMSASVTVDPDINGTGAWISFGGGAAISLSQTSSSLAITSCFFHNCRCLLEDDMGGAVFFGTLTNDPGPISVTGSSFTDCYLDFQTKFNSAGSLSVRRVQSALIDHCFFDSSYASTDGALYISSEDVTVAYCSFVNCSAEHHSGALTLYTAVALSLFSCVFRECSSTNDPSGKDVYFSYNASSQITPDMFHFCDSTSGEDNVYFKEDKQSDNTLIPQISSTPTINSVSVSRNGDKATVTVESDQEISGTMGVLLNGSIVPRLVHVVFGTQSTKSTIGTVVVTSGKNGVLPSATYKHHKTALATAQFFQPTVRRAAATLNDLTTTTIVLRGTHLGRGSYSMLVENGGSELNITLSWSEWTTALTATAPLSPESAEWRLKWATEYEVTKVLWIPEDEPTEQEVAIAGKVTFTTPPEPPALTSFLLDRYDEQKKVVYFNLTGMRLDPKATYKVGLSASASVNHTIDMKYSTTNGKWEGSAVLYPSFDAKLMYGKKYTVYSFRSGTDPIELPRDTLQDIEIIPEPARLTRIWTAASQYRLTLNLTTRVLTPGSDYLMEVSGTPRESGSNEEHNTTFTVTAQQATYTSDYVTVYPFADNRLRYGHDYVVKEMKRKSDNSDVLIENSTTVISMPTEPLRLTGFKVSHYDSEMKTVTFVMEGRALDQTKSYYVSLKASPKYPSIDMDYNQTNGKWEGSAVLYPSTEAKLVYGKKYSFGNFGVSYEYSDPYN
ncbi:hypothetical protein BLNAU_19868 [Blattamonas nauphoetae]|uniref:Uncharacterized protein n=1 Tax=Blattamonas nauphoetae TaxID=2049346 RepID=A0ABQ9X0W8_9EUKA|nr:hypothetical protein BLNAU_19868 [Blattamonas nauphoetae]